MNYELLYPTDQRLLSRIDETASKMKKALDQYEFGLAKIAFEEFFWTDFCDNYLEMVKARLYKPEQFEHGEQKKQSAQYTLYHALYAIIRMMAPYMPHVTEAMYLDYFKQFEGHVSLHTTDFPTPKNSETSLVSVSSILDIITQVRGYKTSKQISLGADLDKLIISGSAEYITTIKLFEDDLRGVTKAGAIEYKEGEQGIEIVE